MNRDLTPWRPARTPAFGQDPFSGFRQEMERLFEDFFSPAETRSFAAPAQAQAQAQAAMVRPNIDVHETEQAYTVTAELPGIDQKDIELNLHDNALTLRGEKRSERSEEDQGRRYSERTYGRFERTIPFSAEVDADRVEASCEHGVLKVVLPKNAQARDKTRRIEIRGIGSTSADNPGQAPAEGRSNGSGGSSAPDA